jgi:K+/H+ antiporter YhaU regulatory subunit KhtT
MNIFFQIAEDDKQIQQLHHELDMKEQEVSLPSLIFHKSIGDRGIWFGTKNIAERGIWLRVFGVDFLCMFC